MKNIAENITFEKAIEELEDIIKSLEQGDVPLDNTIELYERGAKLKDFCEKKLIDAEIKIKKINKYSNTKEISIED
jgi:exodeoxyribonuclease VII small subunit